MGATRSVGPITIDDCKMVQVIEKLLVDVNELQKKVKELEFHNKVVAACNKKEREDFECRPI